jgi:hypothetical protein
MAKKQYFAILDTETTIVDTVADFAMVIVDRTGTIHAQCAVIIKTEFDKGLFYDKTATGMWSREYAQEKAAKYEKMMIEGTRMASSVSAVNRWIDRAIGKYNPMLTAYNLAFDQNKCANTGIDLTKFTDRFCLWQSAVGNICKTKQYRKFILENHMFNAKTQMGNLTFSTNAETVAGFLSGTITDEPHTALEDAVYYELPILQHVLKKRGWREKIQPYAWQDFQVRDNFLPL